MKENVVWLNILAAFTAWRVTARLAASLSSFHFWPLSLADLDYHSGCSRSGMGRTLWQTSWQWWTSVGWRVLGQWRERNQKLRTWVMETGNLRLGLWAKAFWLRPNKMVTQFICQRQRNWTNSRIYTDTEWWILQPQLRWERCPCPPAPGDQQISN